MRRPPRPRRQYRAAAPTRSLAALLAVMALAIVSCSTDSAGDAAGDSSGEQAAPATTLPDLSDQEVQWCRQINEIPLPPTEVTVATFETLLEETPTDWHDDLQVFLDASRDRIADPALHPMETDPAVVEALGRFQDRCVRAEILDPGQLPQELQDLLSEEDLQRLEEQPFDLIDPDADGGPQVTLPDDER